MSQDETRRFVSEEVKDIVIDRKRKIAVSVEEKDFGRDTPRYTLFPTTIMALRTLEKNEELQWVRVAQLRLPNDRLVFVMQTDQSDEVVPGGVEHDAIYESEEAQVSPPDESEGEDDVQFFTEYSGVEREGVDMKITRKHLNSPQIQQKYNAVKEELESRKNPA